MGGLDLHVAAEAVEGLGDAGEGEGGLVLGAVNFSEHLGEGADSGVGGLQFESQLAVFFECQRKRFFVRWNGVVSGFQRLGQLDQSNMESLLQSQ